MRGNEATNLYLRKLANMLTIEMRCQSNDFIMKEACTQFCFVPWRFLVFMGQASLLKIVEKAVQSKAGQQIRQFHVKWRAFARNTDSDNCKWTRYQISTALTPISTLQQQHYDWLYKFAPLLSLLLRIYMYSVHVPSVISQGYVHLLPSWSASIH